MSLRIPLPSRHDLINHSERISIRAETKTVKKLPVLEGKHLDKVERNCGSVCNCPSTAREGTSQPYLQVCVGMSKCLKMWGLVPDTFLISQINYESYSSTTTICTASLLVMRLNAATFESRDRLLLLSSK